MIVDPQQIAQRELEAWDLAQRYGAGATEANRQAFEWLVAEAEELLRNEFQKQAADLGYLPSREQMPRH